MFNIRSSSLIAIRVDSSTRERLVTELYSTIY